MNDAWTALAGCLDLGSLLTRLRERHRGYELVFHHAQGEFHHDVCVVPKETAGLPAPVLVIATNCNGGVKEVLALGAVPSIGSVWRWRLPEAAEFEGPTILVLAQHRTLHWFEPAELLSGDTRSELRDEWRERQPGGGWRMRTCAR